jgi:hypothetical protein
MLPVKIKKFNGLYTNYDPNDLSLEVFVQSDNFKHTKGKLIPIPEHLTEGFLPDVDQFHNEAPGTWSLEKYAIIDITNDPLEEMASYAIFRVHFAIFKRSYIESGTTYYVRSCWFREEDSPSWYELSNEGNYSTNIYLKSFDDSETDPHLRYGPYFLTTNIDGKVFISEHDGILKIFMPHDCFWFGKIKRTNKMLRTEKSYDMYYFDRLIDKWNGGIPGITYDFNLDVINTNDYRGSFDSILTVVTSGSVVADTTTVYYGGYEETTIAQVGSPFAHYRIHAWNAVYDSKGNVISWGDLVGPAIYSQYHNGSYTRHWGFKDYGLGSTYVRFHKEYFDDRLAVYNRSTGAAINMAVYFDPTASVLVQRADAGYVGVTNNAGWYVFPAANIVNGVWEIRYEGISLISDPDVGFPASYTEAWIIMTVQLDNREEYVVVKRRVNVLNTNLVWAYRMDESYVPLDNNARVTRYFLYLKFAKDDDYEQYKEFICNEDTLSSLPGTYITQLDKTGKFLSQTIGFTFTEDKDNYGIQQRFSDYIVNNGFGYALYANDPLNVYHSAYGRGKIMPDLFYPDSRIDVEGVSFVKKLIPIGIHLGLITNIKTVLISTQAVDSTLVFETFDILAYGIEDREDALEVQGGAIIKTREGIFYTDGYQIRDKISEFIDNLVRTGTGKIYYNPVKHELYWIYSTSPVKYIRYRFEEKVWETLHKIQAQGLVDLIVSPEGSVGFITDDVLFLEDLNSLDFEGYAKTVETDLAHPETDKYLDEVIVDAKGSFNIWVYGDGKLIHYFQVTESIRTTQKIFYPLLNRFPFVKLYVEITSADVTAELYDITLMIDVVPRRQDG